MRTIGPYWDSRAARLLPIPGTYWPWNLSDLLDHSDETRQVLRPARESSVTESLDH
jgi:hypothetical protein